MRNLESSPSGEMEDEGSIPQSVYMILQDDGDFPSNSIHDCLEQIPSVNSHPELGPFILDQETVTQDILKPADNSPVLSHLPGERKSTDTSMERRSYFSPAKGLWQDVTMHKSDYLTTSESHRYTSSGTFSLSQPQAAKERPTHVIDPERGISEHEAGEYAASTLHMDSGEPLFYSYPSQNCSELLSGFPKEPGMLPAYSYHHANSHRLQLQMVNESLSHSGQYSHQFQEQRLLIEQRQARESELSMHQIMNRNMYSNESFLNQGHMPSIGSHGLYALQPSVNGGLVGHSWFHQEHHAQSSCSRLESIGGGQCVRDVGNVNGNLFSVLSQCNKLPSQSTYGTAPSEQLMQARDFIGGSLPNSDDMHLYGSNQVRSSSEHDVAVAPTDLIIPWLNYPHSDSSMHGSVSKPFLRSWNQ